MDGTLLEIAPTPDEVQVGHSLKQLLMDVRRALNGAVALVSGRSIDALDRLFAPQRWPVAGLHGLERRDARGQVHRTVEYGPTLDHARRTLGDFVARTPGLALEDKRGALAVHYRAAPELGPRLRRAVQAVADRLGPAYHVLGGKFVFELKPSIATKADAVREFLSEPPFAGRRPIYIGDDVTDLDGFAAVERAGGLSIAVGDGVRAQARVASPREVRSLLAGLVDGRAPVP